jgi:high-affinity Fe2+/Pb2+ permease
MVSMILMQLLAPIALILIALGVGAVICQNAKKETGALKIISHIIGVIIVVVAVLLLVVVIHRLSVSSRMSSQMMQRPMMQGQQMRPQMMQPPAPKTLEKAVSPTKK